jgi:hypothetical protein
MQHTGFQNHFFIIGRSEGETQPRPKPSSPPLLNANMSCLVLCKKVVSAFDTNTAKRIYLASLAGYFFSRKGRKGHEAKLISPLRVRAASTSSIVAIGIWLFALTRKTRNRTRLFCIRHPFNTHIGPALRLRILKGFAAASSRVRLQNSKSRNRGYSPSPALTFFAAAMPTTSAICATVASRSFFTEPKCVSSFSAVLVPMPGMVVSSVCRKLRERRLRW